MNIMQIILLSLLISLLLFLSRIIFKRLHALYIRRKKVIPEQLAILIEQAFRGDSFSTVWNIMVSNDMKIALCAPLTREQILSVWQDKEDIISCNVHCSVVSHKQRSAELSGVVCVSADITSYSGKNNYSFHDVMTRVTVKNTDEFAGTGKRWYVSSAEQIKK